MLKIALLLALSQVDEDLPFPPDPFDHNLPPLSVNDTDPKASKDPSFLHIGLCVGADIDEKPILIADRLCFNRSALEIINNADVARTQDMVKLSNENERLSRNISETSRSRSIWFWAAQAYFCVLIALLMYLHKTAKE